MTHWFDAENNYNPELDMVVYDLENHKYTSDGQKWEEIVEDHL